MGKCHEPRDCKCDKNQTVKGNLKVCKSLGVCGNGKIKGDLCVDGKIKNVCLDLEKYCPAPPTQEVYEQESLLVNPTNGSIAEEVVLEVIEDLSLDLQPRNPGVFGYDPNDVTVPPVPIIDGGQLYSDSLESKGKVDYRIHSVNPIDEKDITIQGMIDSIGYSVDFFTARGFQIPGPDTFPENEASFNFGTNLVQVAFFGVGDANLNFKFHYTNESDPLPSDIDISAVNRTTSFNLGNTIQSGPYVYEANPADRGTIFTYPIRVPITQDKEVYQTKSKTKEPIVYYNNITQQLVINVVDINFVSFNNPNYIFDATLEGVPAKMIMKGIQGKVQLTRRSLDNQLISSPISKAEYLIQTSEDIKVQCITSVSNVTEDTSFTLQYRNGSGEYTGMVASLINGGAPSFDIRLIDPGILNAFSSVDMPLLNLPCCAGDLAKTDFGDNVNTIPVEKLGGPTSFQIFDSSLWSIAVPLLSYDYINTPPIPENFSTFPLVSVAPKDIIPSLINSHEYMHSIQIGMGLYPQIDGEGQALAIELNADINRGIYAAFRPNDFVEYTTWTARGLNPLGATESQIPFGTYGAGMYWNWLTNTHDAQTQVMRRSNDIMSTIVAATQDQYTNTASDNFSYYGGSYRLAQKQAVSELLGGLTLENLYRDFAISMSLMRNNTSIDSVYHSKYPYWTQQVDYPDAAQAAQFSPESKYWWTELDTNVVSPSAQRLGFDTMLPQLTGDLVVELEDLASNILVVDKGMTSVTVSRDAVVNSDVLTDPNLDGKMFVTMHQFTSGGAPNTAGTFVKQGPFALNVGGSQMFNLADFPDAGIVRLVVSNVNISDYGAVNNLFLTPGIDRITGKLSIVTV